MYNTLYPTARLTQVGMGEHIESLFQRAHNQLCKNELDLIAKHKEEVASHITHVIDCEAWTW